MNLVPSYLESPPFVSNVMANSAQTLRKSPANLCFVFFSEHRYPEGRLNPLAPLRGVQA